MKINNLIFFLVVILTQLGCTVKWTEAIQYGHIKSADFNEKIDIKIQQGLIFIPVTINGINYRFLFDSGAPFSVSKELQVKHSFKTISKGNIIDSDHNKKKVDWVKVEDIQIGTVSFLNQTAFVGDFKANPLLKCLNIDGIIGSNLMRYCNWTINQDKKQLSLNNTIDSTTIKESISIPFKTDLQYNIFLNINVGKALVKSIRVDYGSNGSIALNKDIFNKLKENKLIDNIYKEKGVQQTGIVGQPVDFTREITVSDSVKIGALYLKSVELKTGKTNLIGNKILSRFIVTIDWNKKTLYLKEFQLKKATNEHLGFKIGYTNNKGYYIQSVLENSIAHKKGVKPNMKVLKIDRLDFENGNDFCDYINLKHGKQVYLELIDSKEKKQQYYIDKISLKNN